jgi:hypothetical protein
VVSEAKGVVAEWMVARGFPSLGGLENRVREVTFLVESGTEFEDRGGEEDANLPLLD